MMEHKLDTLTTNDLVEHDILAQAFKKYLMDILYYDECVADYVVEEDFANPYITPYISLEYVDDLTIADIAYEVFFCKTDYRSCGLCHLDGKPDFSFYMLIDQEAVKNHTVGEYQDASKKYVILGLRRP